MTPQNLLVMNTVIESIDTVIYHFREGNLRWPMIIYLSLAHVAAFYGILAVSQCQWYTLLFAFILWPISGFGITGGAHRYERLFKYCV